MMEFQYSKRIAKAHDILKRLDNPKYCTIPRELKDRIKVSSIFVTLPLVVDILRNVNDRGGYSIDFNLRCEIQTFLDNEDQLNLKNSI